MKRGPWRTATLVAMDVSVHADLELSMGTIQRGTHGSLDRLVATSGIGRRAPQEATGVVIGFSRTVS